MAFTMQAADPSLVSVNLAPLWPAAPCQKIPWSTVISIATSTAEHGPTVGLGVGVGLAVGVATLVGVARPVGVAVAPFDVVAVTVSPGPPVVGTGVLDDSPHPTRTATSASAPNADSRAPGAIRENASHLSLPNGRRAQPTASHPAAFEGDAGRVRHRIRRGDIGDRSRLRGRALHRRLDPNR